MIFFQILVYLIAPNGQVIADERSLDVSKCLPHNVSLSWSIPKAEPGKEAQVTIKGAKNSLCSLGR